MAVSGAMWLALGEQLGLVLCGQPVVCLCSGLFRLCVLLALCRVHAPEFLVDLDWRGNLGDGWKA